MQLIGYMDSPFVRRVAVTAQFLGLPYEHKAISVFRDFEEFRRINPLVKVPTLVCDDGQVLVDSTLIIDYFESLAGGARLMPADETSYVGALNAIGTSLVAMEKTAQLIYETKHRPEAVQHPPWLERLAEQLGAALERMEEIVGDGTEWLYAGEVTQADISTAIAWRFVQSAIPERAPKVQYPGLVVFSARAEALPEFKACPLS